MIVIRESELLLVVKQNKKCISGGSLSRVLKFAKDLNDVVILLLVVLGFSLRFISALLPSLVNM